MEAASHTPWVPTAFLSALHALHSWKTLFSYASALSTLFVLLTKKTRHTGRCCCGEMIAFTYTVEQNEVAPGTQETGWK